MNLFGSPNIEKMAAEHDYDGLYQLLEHRDMLVRLQAAQALADMNDGTGWRFLIETLRGDDEPAVRGVAAAMLGELGHPRAVAPLKEVLQKLRFAPISEELAEAVRLALESIDSPEAEEALRGSGYEPVLKGQSHTVIEYEPHYARQVLEGGSEVRFLTAEQHLNNAVELREAELTERGLVEDSLALWLSPDWGYAWYLRGVLFEDLERSFEALLAYRRAVELEPSLREAREALEEVQAEVSLPPDAPDLFLSGLKNRDWSERRNGAAGIADLAMRGDPAANQAADALIALLEDEEREVRHTALDALAWLGRRRAVPAVLAVPPILAMEESSWLVRFSVLQALAWFGAVDALISALRREMTRIQERNPIFSSQKDPMLEVEYEALMEIGARALERTGDLEALLSLAEGNAWVETDEEGEEESAEETQEQTGAGGEVYRMGYAEELEADEAESEEEEEVDDLSSYVDEVAEMAVVALGRLAEPALPDLPPDMLTRLSKVPDLTLIDLEDEQAQPVLVRDLAGLREAAAAELRRRGKE
jgi:HEAT repeat protein